MLLLSVSLSDSPANDLCIKNFLSTYVNEISSTRDCYLNKFIHFLKTYESTHTQIETTKSSG